MSSTRNFEALRVAVLGDLIADRYVYATPSRLSREAPVMVLKHRSERFGAGGAANVAMNLRSLGASVRLFGAVGLDAGGRELLRMLEDEGVQTSEVQTVRGYKTPTKTRVLAAEPRRSLQQVLRIDEEPEAAHGDEVHRTLRDALLRAADEIDALILSDYEYGCLSKSVGDAARELSSSGTVCVLDPRCNLEDYTGLTALTPNVGEVARFTGTPAEELDDEDALRVAARKLLEHAQARYLLVTRGNLGMALFGDGIDPDGVAVEASGTGEVTDVSGAGDTAAAAFTLALAAGHAPADAMALANAASGVVVMENGAATCPRAALDDALGSAPSPVLLGRRDFS